jgi:L-lactate dehydrogenase (cytochrome)
MRLSHCHNFHDFRRLARQRLPAPIFNYIDGAADDEVTHRRNSASFEHCDLVPSILRGVENVDLSVTVMGQKLAVPFYCSPTALQRLFHHQGERAVAAAASKFGTMFGVSSLGTVAVEELRKAHSTPQVYQFYFHKDRGLNRAMLQKAKVAGVEVMMLTVDSITGGNRERDLRTGFSIPFRLTPRGMMQFAIKPRWGINYLTHERFKLPQLDAHVDMSGSAVSIGRYFTEMLDPSMNWGDVAEMVRLWDANSVSRESCRRPTPGVPQTLDAPASLSPITAADSWTVHVRPLIRSPRSSTPWAIASMSSWTAASSEERMC